MIFRFLEDLEEGVFIQQTLESVLHNEDGKQLMVCTFLSFIHNFSVENMNFFQDKLLKQSPESFPVQDHFQSRIISSPGSFPVQDHFQSRIISSPGSFPVQDHFQSRIISSPGSFPVQDHFQSRIISSPGSFPVQDNFQSRIRFIGILCKQDLSFFLFL